jgi:uncharacterized protein (DUF433 family)
LKEEGDASMKQEQTSGQPSWKDRIAYDSAVLSGKPLIKGTRLAVEFIIDLLAQGWTQADILESYPGLSHEDIRACLVYARDTLSERVYPIGA